jgi:hypothetical protein
MNHSISRRSRAGRQGRRVLAAGATAGAVVLTGIVGLPSTAAGADGEVTVATAASRTCQAARAEGAPGTASRTLTASADGLLRTSLTGSGDWDVAVFDRTDGRLVASSAGFGGVELASGFVRRGQSLHVQACRLPGGSATARLMTNLQELGEKSEDTLSVVEVTTVDRAAKKKLQGLGLDLTEHGTADSVEVVLHGKADAEKLKDAGFEYTVEIADLAAKSEQNRAADEAYAATTTRSGLPSGRDSYRRLADYEAEMKALAAEYPDLVKPLTLPNKTVEGREVHGIEITTNAANTADGKPVFFNMGVHHAREWPSGEHAMEWAYELLTGYGKDPLTTQVVQGSRTIVVPIVNPDGFTVSREAGEAGDAQDLGQFVYEYKRKNCAISTQTPEEFRAGTCADNPAGRLRGTDPNRNYGGFWGGAGASPYWLSDTFRGDGPFSEPEVQNVRELISERQVTNLITNHTYSNLVLRVPGVYAVRPPLEEPQYKALGDRLASKNGYTSQPSWALYDTTGSLEDWSFFNTGGFGFTYEIGPDEFHPPFQQGVVDEYLGNPGTAGAGKGGNRASYFEMAKATLDTSFHSTLTGQAPEGWTLDITKTFSSETSPVQQLDGSVTDPLTYTDTLTSSLTSRGGTFTWAVNPSTRPLVAGRYGRDPLAPAQPSQTFANPAGVPAENEGSPLAVDGYEEVGFTIGGLPEYDNGTATVSIQWTDPNVDWDLYIFNSEDELVGQSAQGGTNREDALVIEPAAGTYRAVMVNYDGGTAQNDWTGGTVTFANPLPLLDTGIKEAWQLSCSKPNGAVVTTREVVVDRGETVDLGKVCQKGKTKGKPKNKPAKPNKPNKP